MQGARRDDHDARAIATAALLVDDVRRRVFLYVRRARRPVTREEAAASAGVSRNLAAFHLDKLVAAGLLRAGSQATGGASRVGRRPKVYEAGPVEVHLDVPGRQHSLLAGVLVEALAAAERGQDVRRAATEAAGRRGRELGRAARAEAAGPLEPAEVAAVLEPLGFEPYEAEPSVLRLANCPFHPLAARDPDLVCGLNHGLIAGVLAGAGTGAVEAVLAPRAGECCVEIRPSGGADASAGER